MSELTLDSGGVMEAVELLLRKDISEHQKLSTLQDWDWRLGEIIEIAMLADEVEKKKGWRYVES